jgi:hypothetical protein
MRKCAIRGVLALGIAALFGQTAAAQATAESLFLLLPVGAQSIGMGQTGVAARGGSEGVWGNPATIAGDTTNEVALHHSQTVVGQGNALALVFSTGHIGTFAPAVNVLDLEEQEAVDQSNNRTGVILPTDVGFSLTYAAQPSKLLAVGVTLKHVEARVRCSGLCTDLPTGGSSSNGADFGAQLRLRKIPLTIGADVRNIGVGEGDARPARFDIGANYRVSAVERYTQQEVALYTAAGVVSTTGLDSASVRMGGDLVFEDRIHVRAGYVYDRENGSGTSIGFGVSTGRFAFDLARAYGGSVLSTDSDSQPTYFSLRYLW